MSASQVILVVISGLGVIHGLFLAAILWAYKKGNALSNRLLSVLLMVLSFRIGKSVFLTFIDNLDVKIIFSGLSTIMAIGPLYFLLVKSVLDKSFTFKRQHIIHFIPAFLGFILGMLLEESHLETLPLYLFAMLFLGYYLHFLIYIIIGFSHAKTHSKNNHRVTSFNFLRLLFYGLLALWVVYVLNLFDENIPYIIGPILYSIIAYGLSYVIFKKDYIPQLSHDKYKTTPISQEQTESIFQRVLELVKEDEQFKNPEISLKTLSASLKVSPQILSLVINQMSATNFNGFINSFRIEAAKEMLKSDQFSNYSVASIAFEVGFNSISSFNAAFKKTTRTTPATFRNH